jgi:hypothetical protein
MLSSPIPLVSFPRQFMELDYLPNPGRGCSCLYGYAAISQVLSNNDLLGIIRGHQCKEEVSQFSFTNFVDTKFRESVLHTATIGRYYFHFHWLPRCFLLLITVEHTQTKELYW